MELYYYYNLKLSDKSKEESCIVFIQENLIEFLVQCIYLIYARLIVYTTWVLAYFEDYIYYILLIYDITSLFWNLLCPSVWQLHVTHVTWCVTVITVICDIVLTLTLSPKNKKKKWIRKEIKSIIFNSDSYSVWHKHFWSILSWVFL